MRVCHGKSFEIKSLVMFCCDAIFFPSALTLHDVVDDLIGEGNIIYFLAIFNITGGIILPFPRMEYMGGLRPGLIRIRIGDGGTITFPLGGCFG